MRASWRSRPGIGGAASLPQSTHLWAGTSLTVGVVTLSDRLAGTLRGVRGRGGVSQLQMAKRLGVGRSTLNRLEAADQNVTIQTLEHLCRVLRCDVGELFGAASGRAQRQRRGSTR